MYLHGQSPDIAQGMVSTVNKGAGNQAIMPGYADYACRQTPELMPAPIYFAHRILKVISEVWHANPNERFVIGELRHRWRGPLELRHASAVSFSPRLSWTLDVATAKTLKIGRASVHRALEGS